MCAKHDMELDIVWRPREDEHQRIADHWSKVQDDAAWALNQAAYDMLIAQKVLEASCLHKTSLLVAPQPRFQGPFIAGSGNNGSGCLQPAMGLLSNLRVEAFSLHQPSIPDNG